MEWHYQREAAESCARKVHGVRGVTNKIEVKPKISTTEVKTKIEDALRRSAEVDARRITISAQDGVGTLNGNFRSWFAKANDGWCLTADRRIECESSARRSKVAGCTNS